MIDPLADPLTDWRTYVAGFAAALLVAWVYWPRVRARFW